MSKPTERSEEALSKGNAPAEQREAAPSPWPPRIWALPLEYEGSDQGIYFAAVTLWNNGWRKQKPKEYLSSAEHTHLLAEAVREAKAAAYEESANMVSRALIHSMEDQAIARLRQMASELRKGATPEKDDEEVNFEPPFDNDM